MCRPVNAFRGLGVETARRTSSARLQRIACCAGTPDVSKRQRRRSESNRRIEVLQERGDVASLVVTRRGSPHSSNSLKRTRFDSPALVCWKSPVSSPGDSRWQSLSPARLSLGHLLEPRLVFRQDAHRLLSRVVFEFLAERCQQAFLLPH